MGVKVLDAQLSLTLATLWTVAHQAPPGKKTGMVSHFLLQGVFLTQESNLGVLHCMQTLLSELPEKLVLHGKVE